ncbi:sensor histidine kinase [Euzebya pacifica]|jgi:signal transduction histidine kinase|nr:HAMP domain-containing sensor histidine kinase [Euzebya pacifica]
MSPADQPTPSTVKSSRTSAVVAGVVGLIVVIGIASALGKPAADTIELIMIAGGAALITGALGGLALHLLRGRSFSAQVVVVALTSTAAVTAGSLAAGNAMFLETRDLQTLAVVVPVGAVVAIVAALLLGERVGAASRSLGEAARRLGDLEHALDPDEHGVMPESMIREFARLAEQLEATRHELEMSREREQATDRARRELVSWVSHDLRTPLAGIRAITELLEDDIVDDPEEIRGYYGTLRREADKLSALVGDLFEVSKIEAGALRLDYTDVNFGDLVSDTLAAAIPVAEKRQIRVYGRVADPEASIEASLPEISRVLRNLVSNAIRESADGGAVLVEAGIDTAWEQDCGFLAVQDTCGGIPEDVIDRVFDASYRGESARTPRHDVGAGLGLAIARGFVEAHGGTISVGNVADGCRFYVRLPARRPDATRPAAPEPTVPPIPLGQPARPVSDRDVSPAGPPQG